MQLLIELGVPGLLLTAWLAAAVFTRARRLRRAARKSPSFVALHAGYCAAMLSVAFHSLTDFGLHLAANAAMLATVLAVVVSSRPPDESSLGRAGRT